MVPKNVPASVGLCPPWLFHGEAVGCVGERGVQAYPYTGSIFDGPAEAQPVTRQAVLCGLCLLRVPPLNVAGFELNGARFETNA